MGNVIAYNGAAIGGPGVGVSNYDGGPVIDTPPVGIKIEGNSIHDNYGLGIDLINDPSLPLGDGVTPNGSQQEPGPNNWQYFPNLSTALSSDTATAVTGTFDDPNEQGQTVTLDFYANANPSHAFTDPNTGITSYYGEGQTYLGAITLNTDDSGHANFSADFAQGTAGQWISATATDSCGSTSEFSADVQATGDPTLTFAQNLQASLPQSSTSANVMTVQADPTTVQGVVDGIGQLGTLSAPVSLYLNLAPGTYSQQTVQVPSGMTLYINGTPGTTIDPDQPALTVVSGNVVVSNATFTTTGNAPTILVEGGSLTLRNDTIQESTGYSDAAIAVTGGTVDMGTASSPGGNTINVNGAGTFVDNTTSNPIAAVGDTFTVNGLPLAPSSLSGIVWEDFNDDGQVDFGEKGISGVKITLTGTDDLGNAVNLCQLTDSDGAYIFLNLRPGNYTITETQPASYLQGIDSVGTAGGSLAATDQFFVQLGVEVDGLNYNYGEQPPAGGSVQPGQTAGIGFWNNKNGQALIKAVNGGTGHQLGDWLAATLPNIFGANAGSSDLAGQGNAAVAALFQSDFLLKGVKLDAQVLATALSVYVTNATLDPTQVAAQYGFTVSGNGAGTATVSIGSNGDAFGVSNNSTLTLMDLLLATDEQAVNGLLYNGNTTRRNEANNVFSAVNQAGDIS